MKEKKGIQTSEMWTSVATTIAGVLVMAGVADSGEMPELVEALTRVIGGIVAAASTLGYVNSRTNVKQAEILARDRER